MPAQRRAGVRCVRVCSGGQGELKTSKGTQVQGVRMGGLRLQTGLHYPGKSKLCSNNTNYSGRWRWPIREQAQRGNNPQRGETC